MVQFSEESPFLQDEGDGQPSAVCSQHVRSLELLKTIVQVGWLSRERCLQVCLLADPPSEFKSQRSAVYRASCVLQERWLTLGRVASLLASRWRSAPATMPKIASVYAALHAVHRRPTRPYFLPVRMQRMQRPDRPLSLRLACIEADSSGRGRLPAPSSHKLRLSASCILRGTLATERAARD